MASANASGDIFSLSADSRFEGLVTGRAGAGARLSVEVAAEACHGLNLEASAAASADANAALAFLLAAQATGSAFASAGVTVRAQIAPNLFDKFGLIADVAAYAQAAAAARLSVGLDFNAIEVLARDHIDGFALELFLAFLKEVDIEAGVWARVAAAAMAEAYAEIQGTLKSDADAGFRIAAGAGAGLGVGGGVDVFFGIGFTDVRRFYTTAVALITKEAIAQARAHTPVALAPAVDLAELLLPVVLHTAYELGQISALGTLQPPDQMVVPFLKAVTQELERYLYRKFEQIGQQLLGQLIDDVKQLFADEGLGDDQRAAITAPLQDAIATARDAGARDLTLDELVAIGGKLLQVVAQLAPESADRCRFVIALGWTAIACAAAATDLTGAASASAGASTVGVGGTVAAAVDRELPAAPAIVLEAYASVLGRPISTIAFDDAIAFIAAAGIGPLLKMYVPPVADLLDGFEQMFGIDASDFVDAALRLSIGEDVAKLDAYRKLRAFAKNAVDGAIENDLIPALRTALGADGSAYTTEVAAPSLLALSNFVFARLDALIGGIGTGEINPFLNSLSAGLSTLVYRIFARNLLFLDTIVFNHVLDSLEDAFQALADEAGRNPNHILVQTLRNLFPVSLPNLPPIAQSAIPALQDFVQEMALAGRDAFGPGVWSVARRNQFRDLKQRILIGFEGSPPYAQSDAIASFFENLILCDYVPDQDALSQSIQFMGDIAVAEAGAIVPRATAALATLLLQLTAGVVQDLEHAAEQFIHAAEDAFNQAVQIVDQWGRSLQQAVTDLAKAEQDLAAALAQIATRLRNADLRSQVLNGLYALGAQRVEAAVRNLDGNPHNPNPIEDAAVATAVGAFHLVFMAATPLFDAALAVVGSAASDAAAVVEDAANATTAMQALAQHIVADAIGAVNGAIGRLGLSLPDQLSANDIGNAIAAALPADILRGLFGDAIGARNRKATAQTAKSNATAHRASAIVVQGQKSRQLAALRPDGAATIAIVSPVAVDQSSAQDWIYGRQIPVRIVVGGIKPSYLTAGRQRIRLSLNTRALHHDAAQWSDLGNGRYRWEALLDAASAPLAGGLNIFEVSVVSGDGSVTRQAVTFLVSAAARPLPGTIAIDGAASHVAQGPRAALNQESVAIAWSGARPIRVTNWRVQNAAASARYTFDDAEIAAGATLTLVTGAAPPQRPRGTVYWNRRSEAWSDKGDIVRLIDPDRVLRAEFAYGTQRG